MYSTWEYEPGSTPLSPMCVVLADAVYTCIEKLVEMVLGYTDRCNRDNTTTFLAESFMGRSKILSSVPKRCSKRSRLSLSCRYFWE